MPCRSLSFSFRPVYQTSTTDVGNFDTQFTSQNPVDSPTEKLSSSVAGIFEGFTYGMVLPFFFLS